MRILPFLRVGVPLVLLVLSSRQVSAVEPNVAEELARYFPADSDTVVFVNVRQLLQAELSKKHALEPTKAILRDNKEVARFLEAVGLDPFQDIHQLFLSGQANTAPKLLAVIRGNFNVEKLQNAADAYVKDNPGKSKIYTGDNLRIYEITENEQTGFATVLDRNTILVSVTREYIVEGVKRKEPRLKAELQSLLKTQDNTQSGWVVGMATEEMKKQAGNNPQITAMVEKITSFAGQIHVTDTIRVQVQIHTSDPKAAAGLARFLADLKGVAVFAVQNIDTYGPLLSSVLETVKVANDKSAVTLNAKITEAVFEKHLPKQK